MKKFRKTFAVLLIGALLLSLAACSQSSSSAAETEAAEAASADFAKTEAADLAAEAEAGEPAKSTVVISCLDENAEAIEKEVPVRPERVAILDYAALDIIDLLGYGDSIVSSAEGTIAYLQEYWDRIDSGDIANLGNLQSYDLETLEQSEPDVIFIGGRQVSNYAVLEEIAPVIYLSVTAGNVYEETIENAKIIAQIFGEDESIIDSYIADNALADTLSALQAQAVNEDGTKKTAGVLMYSDESTIGVLSSTGRCSLIGNEVGYEILAGSDANHGDAASFETLAELDPDYFFVLNRGYITSQGENGNEAVKEVLINKVTETTTSTFIVLANPDAWYTAEGGIQALNTMLGDLASELL